LFGAFATEQSSNFLQSEPPFYLVGTTKFGDKDNTIINLLQGGCVTTWVVIRCESYCNVFVILKCVGTYHPIGCCSMAQSISLCGVPRWS